MNAWIHRWAEQPEIAGRDAVIFLCTLAVLFSVAWSFLNHHGRRPVAHGQRSAVDTLTMLIFFVGFSWLLTHRVGEVRGMSGGLARAALLLGLALVVLGAGVNVIGRHQLGVNWANQIAIYQRHELQTDGTFRWVRHPLYASLIWMFLGASLAHLNWAAGAATALIFIPAMYYRAWQEERMLIHTFPEYVFYQSRTGTFFPKLFHRPHGSL